MKFRVLSHHAATKYNPRLHGHGSAVMIRITSMPDFMPLLHGPEFKDVLHLRFDDTTLQAVNMLPQDQTDNIVLFDEHHGKLILDFYAHWKDHVDVIVVHCDAGISRSSAVAISLAEYGNHQDELDRMTSGHEYWPNPHVWTTIRHLTGWDKQRQDDFEELFKFVEEVNKHVL